MAGLFARARDARCLESLIADFAASVACDGFDRHLCVSLGPEGERPLFGDGAVPSADATRLWVGAWDERALELRLSGANGRVTASLRGRAEVYATFAMALLQCDRDIVTGCGLGVIERHCLARLLVGEGEAVIAARLGIAPLAVRGLVDSACAKLGQSSRAEAVALAARRGLLAGLPVDCGEALAAASN